MIKFFTGFLVLFSINSYSNTPSKNSCKETVIDAYSFMGQSVTEEDFASASSLNELGLTIQEYKALSISQRVQIMAKLSSVQTAASNAYIDLQVYFKDQSLEQRRGMIKALKAIYSDLSNCIIPSL